MEFITLFKDFGFPALVVGVLLWIITTKLEKIALTLQQNHDMLVEIKAKTDLIQASINASREQTRPRSQRGG